MIEEIDTKKWTSKIKKINDGKNKKFSILTMGCQLNENDSEKMAGMLNEAGYTKTDNVEEADVIVFNTCCVRENAEERLLGKLGDVKKYKEAKGTIIAIGGCMMQEKNMVEKLNKSYKYIDIIFGPHTMNKFPEDLYNVIINKKKIEDILDIDGDVFEGIPVLRDDTIKASIPIMNGCDNFCTYCIVPYVRGRERSRNPQDIINECETIAKQGYKEIMLLGQNVNSYLVSEREKNKDLSFNVTITHNDLDKKNITNNDEQKNVGFENEKNNLENNILNISNKYTNDVNNLISKKCSTEVFTVNSFATLLRAINKIDGIERIRFISPHPKDFTDDVIDAIKDCEKVCKLIHLPLQSGSTNVLNKMNRKYTKEQYLRLVDKIRNKIPEATFTTDIIVGFPGETDEDFEDTLDVVKKVNYEQIFMFIYSRRVGTVADKMENQVDEKVKHERFERLKKLYEEMCEVNNKKYLNKIEKVLVEGKSKTNPEMLTGRTDSNKIVNFKGNDDLIGKMVKVKIICDHLWYLEGSCDTI